MKCVLYGCNTYKCTPIGDTKLELLLSLSYNKKCNYKRSQQNCRQKKLNTTVIAYMQLYFIIDRKYPWVTFFSCQHLRLYR